MPNIVGVRFKDAGKTYYFDPGDIELALGDWAVVETAQGRECGLITMQPQDAPDEHIVQPLKKVLRKATADDMRVVEERAGKEKHALDVCAEKVRAHNLDMNLVNVEYAFDGSKIIFYFTADGRVDFRSLVRDLASVFRTRIELRQIGVRDEVKMLGGLGPCGREACCRAFLTDFSPVSIRMAKDQSLSLNPTKISGLCGRLMCCLNYEQEHYQTTLQHCPRKGATVLTPEGPATIDDLLILKEKVKVRLIGEEVEIREYPFEEVKEANQADIAQWEASGGRARAVAAKAAYKQAQSKPKPKEEEPLSPFRFAFSDIDEEEAEGGQPMPSEEQRTDAPQRQPAEEDFEDNDEDDAEESVEKGEAPPVHAAQAQPRPFVPRQPNQPNPQQQPQQPHPAGTGSSHRRRRGGRRRGGFHGGPNPNPGPGPGPGPGSSGPLK